MADLLAVEHVNYLLVLGNGLLRAVPKALRGEFIAVPELIVGDELKDAQEFGLPFLALVKEVHVLMETFEMSKKEKILAMKQIFEKIKQHAKDIVAEARATASMAEEPFAAGPKSYDALSEADRRADIFLKP